MKYFKACSSDGRILGVGKTSCNTANEITAEEFERISTMLANPPGTGYALYDDSMEWKPYTPPEPTEDEATSEDYQNELRRLGVEV